MKKRLTGPGRAAGRPGTHRRRRAALGALVLLALLLAAALLWGRPRRPKPAEPAFAANATIGALPDKTDKEIEAMLQQAVDEKSVAFSIKYDPTFASGSAEGELKMESPGNNINYIFFTIALDETGELIYESGLLKPNSYIYSDRLQTKEPLPKGTYPCSATVPLVDRETLGEIGSVQAALALTVQS